MSVNAIPSTALEDVPAFRAHILGLICVPVRAESYPVNLHLILIVGIENP